MQRTLERVAALRIEAEARQEIVVLNERIRNASFAVTWGPSVDVVPLEVDEVAGQWRAQRLGNEESGHEPRRIADGD
jgi:hypothetical protein